MCTKDTKEDEPQIYTDSAGRRFSLGGQGGRNGNGRRRQKDCLTQRRQGAEGKAICWPVRFFVWLRGFSSRRPCFAALRGLWRGGCPPRRIKGGFRWIFLRLRCRSRGLRNRPDGCRGRRPEGNGS